VIAAIDVETSSNEPAWRVLCSRPEMRLGAGGPLGGAENLRQRQAQGLVFFDVFLRCLVGGSKGKGDGCALGIGSPCRSPSEALMWGTPRYT
jgi:hypothetical protein